MTTIIEVAKQYHDAGLWVIPVSSPLSSSAEAGKAPVFKGWQSERTPLEKITDKHNLGVVAGKVSGIICVDIDPRNGGDSWYAANEDDLGNCIIETTGSGGLHLYYRYPAEFETIPSLASGKLAPGVDFLADGGKQFVTWPSVHKSGGSYTFKNGLSLLDVEHEADPPPAWLLKLVFELKGESVQTEQKGTGGEFNHPADIARASEYAATYPPAVQGQGGDARTYHVCLKMRDYALDEAMALTVVEEHYSPRCSPPWSHSELRRKIANAYKYGKTLFGCNSIMTEFEQEKVEETPQPPQKPKKKPSHDDNDETGYTKNRPIQNAKFFLSRFSHLLLFNKEQGFYYDEARKHWILLDDLSLKGLILSDIAREAPDFYPFVNSNILREISLMTMSLLQGSLPEFTVDKWLDGREGNYVSVKNGIVNLDTGTLEPHSSKWFSFTTLPFDYDPNADAPLFQNFLSSVWSDSETIEALQLWVGYLLLGDMRQQKFALFIGESRSGKGTLATVISQLIGEDNCVACTLTQLAGEFGLSPLISKRAVFFHDAQKAQGSMGDLATERLISIVGNDPQSVNRKNREIMTIRLPLKITMVCNQIPSFINTRGALTNRMIVFPFNESFKGKEDFELGEKLKLELPGIFNWAMKGAQQIHNGVRLFQSKRSEESLTEITRLLEPIAGFLADATAFEQHEEKWEFSEEAEAFVSTDDLYRAYVIWCDEKGHNPKSATKFAMEVKSWLPPGVVYTQRRRDGYPKRGYLNLALRRPVPEFN